MSKITERPNFQSRPFLVPTSSRTSSATRSSKQTLSSASEVFYSLTKVEESSVKFDGGAMKRVSSDVRLKLGNKSEYLKARYDQIPTSKYNFSEATSWRYGWNQWNLSSSISNSYLFSREIKFSRGQFFDGNLRDKSGWKCWSETLYFLAVGVGACASSSLA